MSRDLAGVRIHVHEEEPRGPEAMHRLLDLVDDARAMEAVLCAMCGETARAMQVDVVSVYARERIDGEDVLVMRGNHGFPAHAVGSVRLALHEGITGLVAERMRPVSMASAAEDQHFKYVPGLGEERYPSFLGVPVARGGILAGVLVLQRARRVAFREVEVTGAAALAVAFALRLARAPQTEQPRSARLHGVAAGGWAGGAMGHAFVVPNLRAMPPAEGDGVALLAEGFVRLEAGLARLAARAPEVTESLAGLRLILADRRLRSELDARVTTHGLTGGLQRVAAEYARAPYRSADSACREVLEERARDIEELCVVLHLLAVPESSHPPHGRVVVAEHPGRFLVAWAAAHGAAALLSEAPVPEALAAVVPSMGQVTALFAWVRSGDLLVIDGESGQVRVNPSEASVARLRRRL